MITYQLILRLKDDYLMNLANRKSRFDLNHLATHHPQLFTDITMFSRTLWSQLRPVVSQRRLFSSVTHSNDIRLTFFTKQNCQLCNEAKSVLDQVLQDPEFMAKPWSKTLNLKFIDIEDPAHKEWFDCYRYDIPVLHIDRDVQSKPVKFMHHFKKDEILEELVEQL